MKRAAVALVVLALGGTAAATATDRPDPNVQAQADGCGRSVSGIYQQQVPNWAYVNDRSYPAAGPPPPPQWLHGVVDSKYKPFLSSHPTREDDPVTHDSYDVNIDVLPDAADKGLLGTANDAGRNEETSRVHTERESASLPTFVWPEPGDRVAMLGSWVWDCDHFAPAGERTELHPFRAVWVTKAVSPRSPTGESEGDLYITTDPTPAGVIADCAHETKGDQAAFKACLHAQPRWHDVSGDYSLTLPSPRKPAGGGALQARVVDLGGPQPTVTLGPTGATVTLHLALSPGQRLTVAKEIFLGWTHPARTASPEHLRLRFRSLIVRRAMDPGGGGESILPKQISAAPGEWVVYWDVAGIWGNWNPLVLRVHDGQIVPGRQTIDFYAPRGRPWRMFAFVRECDFGSLAFSDQAQAPWPCPANPKEFGDAGGDDSPGVIVNRFATPEAGIGLHKGIPLLTDNTCPRSNRKGCYELDYVVTRVR